MFHMQTPWWEFIVRATVVYLVLLVMVRVTGKRAVGQFTPFDLIVVMLLAEGVSGSITAQDDSLPGGLIVAATLMVLDVAISFATARSRRIDTIVQGKPVLIGRDGEIYRDVLQRERVPVSDMEKALRAADCAIEEMHMAILEADGKISVLKK